MPLKNESSVNDFGKNELFKDMMDDVAKLSSDIRQPDKFAQIFCEAANTQKNIDHTLRQIVIDLLGKDIAAQQAVTSIVEKVDRNYQRMFIGKAGLALWTIVLLFVEAILVKLFK